MATRVAGWHPERIKAEIRIKGSSLAELSRRNDYHPESGKRVLRSRWRAMELIVARFLGVAAAVIWPERYPKRRARKGARRG